MKQEGAREAGSEGALPNYAQALRQLREAEMALEVRRKQVRVEGVRARRGSWKAGEQQARQQLHKSIHEENAQVQQTIANIRIKQLQRQALLRQLSHQSRQRHLQSSARSRLETLESKLRMKQQVLTQKQLHEERIQQKREEELRAKQGQVRELQALTRRSRVVVDRFQNSRIESIRSSQDKLRDQLLEKVKAMREEIDQLEHSQRTEPDHSLLPSSISNHSRLKSVDSTTWVEQLYRAPLRPQKRKKSISETVLKGNNTVMVQL